VHFAASQALPLFIADGAGDAAVEDGNVFIPEPFFETREELGGQGNFRNEIDNPSLAAADLLHSLEIDFCFTAPGYAVQKKSVEFTGLEVAVELL